MRSTTTETQSSTSSSVIVRVLLWAIPLALGFGLWVFSSPVGANPDEPSHMIYSWSIATGQGFGDADVACSSGVRPCPRAEVDVPADLIGNPGCYAFRPERTAECTTALDAGVHTTYMVRYPPLYYATIGASLRIALAVGIDGGTAAYLGRAVSALISITLLAPALALAWARARRLVPALIVLLTPMTLFMVGAINPSGAEIAAAMAATTAIVVLAGSTRHRYAQMLLCYALMWLTWSRPFGFLWTAAIIVFGLAYIAISDTIVRSWRDLARDLAVVIGVAVANVLAGFVWLLYANQVHSDSGDGPSSTLPQDGIETYLAIALRWGGMLWENLGVLGWLDATLPFVLMLATAATLAIALYEPVYSADVDIRRRRIAAGYMVCIVVGSSLIMLYQTFLWQGRYAWPALAAGYLLLVGTSPRTTTRPMLGIAITAWVIGVLGAMWFYARHVYGIQPGARQDVPNISDGAKWFGPLGNFGYVLVALVSACSLPAVFALARRRERDQDA